MRSRPNDPRKLLLKGYLNKTERERERLAMQALEDMSSGQILRSFFPPKIMNMQNNEMQ